MRSSVARLFLVGALVLAGLGSIFSAAFAEDPVPPDPPVVEESIEAPEPPEAEETLEPQMKAGDVQSLSAAIEGPIDFIPTGILGPGPNENFMDECSQNPLICIGYDTGEFEDPSDGVVEVPYDPSTIIGVIVETGSGNDEPHNGDYIFIPESGVGCDESGSYCAAFDEDTNKIYIYINEGGKDISHITVWIGDPQDPTETSETETEVTETETEVTETSTTETGTSTTETGTSTTETGTSTTETGTGTDPGDPNGTPVIVFVEGGLPQSGAGDNPWALVVIGMGFLAAALLVSRLPAPSKN